MKTLKTLSLLVFFSFFTLMTGCGYKEGVKSQERVSYLYFTGNAKGAEVIIDEAPAFVVEKLGVNEQYKISPGKHRIVVTKEGAVLVKRDLLLGDGIAREIYVP